MELIQKETKRLSFPLLCWDIYSMFLLKKGKDLQKDNDLLLLEILNKKHQWNTDLKALLANSYEALILTDASQKIQWVNKGFTKMTGYSAHHTIGKTTVFLQGPNTNPETRKRIREKLMERVTFTETVVNYRKNKEEYLCEVTITPLLNSKNELTHYIALENQLSY
jgi:PAS domain S-box-containing protein